MIRIIPTVGGWLALPLRISRRSFAHLLLVISLCSVPGTVVNLFAAERETGTNAAETNASEAADTAPRFAVTVYKIEGKALPSTEAGTNLFSRHTGTNVSLNEIAATASELQAEYRRQGYPDMTVSVAPDQIKNGMVIMHVFQGAVPQILVSGKRYPVSGGELAATNSPSTATNATPHIAIEAYEVNGNSLLSDDVLQSVFSKYIGTNVTFDDIGNMLKELTLEYRDRGYDTVSVTTPVQRITNGIIKIQIFEGTLASIKITGNRYFSSNNIMRTLPSLKTNMILNSKVFQAELDRANANQDRQIYPQIGEGSEPDTSSLTLGVKDRLPLHAKVDFNNQNTPDTPALRLNSSAVYNNLWQMEHSFGVQYSFSPEDYKQGDQWNFYDLPLIANYSAFYRLPLGNPGSVSDAMAANPGNFGYNEGSRKFNLPPPSGVPELNVYASGSSIDTGVQTLSSQTLYNVPGVRQVTEVDVQQDLTVNDDLGFRLSAPTPQVAGLASTLSGGMDYKYYDLQSYKTNNFQFIEITLDAMGHPNPPVISEVSSPVPVTINSLHYVPVALRYDGTLRDSSGTTYFGLGMSVNAWFSGTTSNLDNITGSKKSRGHWVILTPSLSHDLDVYHNWMLSLRADGQWASEPLIDNEQFGAGGIASVRGYHEGEVFGDTGWHLSAEQKTPPLVVGYVNGRSALSFRGSIYMDYARTYLLDPQGRVGQTPLWGTGLGLTGMLGTHWAGRFWFSVPLLDAGSVEAYHPFVDFSLTAQF